MIRRKKKGKKNAGTIPTKHANLATVVDMNIDKNVMR